MFNKISVAVCVYYRIQTRSKSPFTMLAVTKYHHGK